MEWASKLLEPTYTIRLINDQYVVAIHHGLVFVNPGAGGKPGFPTGIRGAREDCGVAVLAGRDPALERIDERLSPDTFLLPP
jgi:hypothetical protein